MKPRLVIATNNAHKLEEITAVVGDKFEIVSLADINCHEDIPETADTLEGNALLKARFVYERYGLDVFADVRDWKSTRSTDVPVYTRHAMPFPTETTAMPMWTNSCKSCTASRTARRTSAR